MHTPVAGSWIRRFPALAPGGRGAEHTVRLVCFPHAGGAAGAYAGLARVLPPGIELLALQYPGRLDRFRERPLDSIPALADAAFEALRTELTGTFAFFGHSMGSVVAFEVARRFEQGAANGPVRLFASARRAPSAPRREQLHLGDDAALLAELERLGGTEREVLDDPEIMALALPVLRADYRAIETYQSPPDARVDCPLTVLVGDADPVTSPAEAADWAAHSTAGTDLRILPGGHFYLDAQLSRVAALVAGALLPAPGGPALPEGPAEDRSRSESRN
ncbi:thioesterase II family protein [Kitasatospora sp. NPDC057015]|uniref:thioesterase II family protein n=1 Tax=Kitasatospora sp. NPDC057015 TaxID=3346001 RepID=UPI003642C6AA